MERRWMPSSSGVAVAEVAVVATEATTAEATSVAAAVAVREVAEATTEATTAEAMMVATAVAVMAVAAETATAACLVEGSETCTETKAVAVEAARV